MKEDGPYSFAEKYCASNIRDCHEHRILNIDHVTITKTQGKSLLTKYIAVLRHQCTLYIL